VCFTFRAPNTYVIDTGAFDDMTESKGILHDMSSPLSLPIVTSANCTSSRAESVSTAKVATSLPLSSVFYIPKFLFNVITISTLTRSLNYSMMFFLYHYVFKGIGTQRMISTGRVYEGLYHLETGANSVSCVSYTSL